MKKRSGGEICALIFKKKTKVSYAVGLYWVVLDSPIDMTDFHKIYGSFGGHVENRAAGVHFSLDLLLS